MKDKRHAGYLLFTAAFFTLCLIPSLGMLFQEKVTPVGNEKLAPKPSLTKAGGSFNWDFLDGVSSYFKDRVALRHGMITANSALTASLFGVITNEDVILGLDGWLYYAETLDDYEGVNLMPNRECHAAARTLSLMREYARGIGVRFLFTAAPNKNSLYPEHMPGRYAISEATGNAERIFAELDKLEVPYADLFTLFRSKDEVLYFETDSHWNNRGAALAGDYMCGAMGISDKGFFGSGYTMQPMHYGDLYLMAYPSGKHMEDDAIFNRPFTFTYNESFHSAEDLRIYTSNKGKAGNLVMFRDSFGNALHPFMAERFGKAFFSRAVPYDLTALKRENADTLVIELVERNLDTLVKSPPVMPAPQRTVAEVPADGTGYARASIKDTDRIEGYVKISGDLTCDGLMDDDSAIYMRFGDVCYEATPAGKGNTPFTLYVPSEVDTSECTMLFYVDGVLTTCPVWWE